MDIILRSRRKFFNRDTGGFSSHAIVVTLLCHLLRFIFGRNTRTLSYFSMKMFFFFLPGSTLRFRTIKFLWSYESATK